MGASRNRSPDGGHPADPQLARRHNLPTRLTSFVGREAALAEAMHLLEGSRLVTLVGSGGIGKTRLALRIATVWWTSTRTEPGSSSSRLRLTRSWCP